MKLSRVWKSACVALFILIPLLAMPAGLRAQTHVVSPEDLKKAAVAATTARQHNLETINSFLSSPQMEKALVSAGIDSAQVKTAVSTLNDQELARLAARSEKAQADFAAGNLSERDLLFLLLGIAALILIIVAVR
ncbi:MAG TPA: PA2779 family protein [Bryobacteraceae bacterium]|nr:PA2779 family protein [Bryobacteraceae bacterium]